MAEYIGQTVYIKPNIIVSCPEFDTQKNYFTAARVLNARNLRNNYHNSKLSDKAIRRIKSAVNWLVNAAAEKKVYHRAKDKWFTFKVNFITLTLPDTSKPIKEHEFKTKLIHPFLQYMRKFYGLRNYIWKIEFQENGKLHIHFTTDTFIHLSVIRETWNRLLNNNGYLDDFEAKWGHRNPNSTDVHSVWKVRDLAAYLAKYLAKNEQNTDKINGRIWGCNHELSDKNKCATTIFSNECAETLKPLMNPEIEYKEIVTQDSLTGKVFRNAELFFIKSNMWGRHITGRLFELYQEHLYKIRGDNQIKMYAV